MLNKIVLLSILFTASLATAQNAPASGEWIPADFVSFSSLSTPTTPPPSPTDVLIASLVMMAPMFLFTFFACALVVRGGKICIAISVPLFIVASMSLSGMFIQKAPILVDGVLGTIVGCALGALVGLLLRRRRFT